MLTDPSDGRLPSAGLSVLQFAGNGQRVPTVQKDEGLCGDIPFAGSIHALAFNHRTSDLVFQAPNDPRHVLRRFLDCCEREIRARAWLSIGPGNK